MANSLKKNYKSILGFFLFISIAAIAKPAFAHQPNYIATTTAITDQEGTISKAYYGELTGKPVIFSVVATSSFELDVNILSPDIVGARKDFSVDILGTSDKPIATLNNPTVSWPRWYEEFGGDWYWQGPEIKQTVPAGTYTVTVQNPGNSGKYVLAIGEAEAFPPSTALHTLGELYTVKTIFFGEPWYDIYNGTIGRYLLYASMTIILIFIAIVLFVVRVLRKRRATFKEARFWRSS